MSTRLVAFALPSLLVAACATPGERAETGQCPPGEVCSSLTPRGLTFDGATFADVFLDAGIHRTATGGTQTLTIYDAASNDPLIYAFDATTDDTAFTIVDHSTGVVRIHARTSGADRLRIDDPSTGELFDRVAITADEVAEISLRTPTFGETTRAGHPLALWPAATVPLVVALFDRTGERLVDESIRITPIGPAIERVTWDAVRLIGTGTSMPLEITLGAGRTLAATLAVTDRLDRIEPHAGGAATTTLHDYDARCFAAVAGPDDVLGAPWQITLAGPANVVRGGLLGPNCIEFESTQTGTLTITAAVGAQRHTLQFVVVAAAARAPALPRALRGPTLGDRAALAAAE